MRTFRPAFRVELAFCLFAFFATASLAQESVNKTIRQTQTRLNAAGSPRFTLLNISNLTTWMRSDGQSSRSPSGVEGTKFPRGTAWVVYQDGIMWGGKAYTDAAMTQPAPFSQLIRVGGANYQAGTWEGWIIGQGAGAVATDPNAPEVRMYRIRRDYYSMAEEDLRRDAAEYFEIDPASVSPQQMQAVRDQYDLDWREWPVQHGAPYIDRNRNGSYDPPPAFSSTFTIDSLLAGGYDEPGIAGANLNFPAGQVTWTVFNDLNSNLTVALQGSEPLGFEVQVTLWGYDNSPALANTFFRRVRMINKGGVQIDAAGNRGVFWIDGMYVAQWADMDIGSFGDDLLGCDPNTSVGYAYNSAATDNAFAPFHLPPPAAGFDLVQGPIVPVPGSTAIFDLKRKNGFANLPMTSFTYFSPPSVFSDPPRNYVQGTLRWYKLLRGFAPLNGPDIYYPFPPGEVPNHFPLSGDPVQGTGFVDGLGQSYSFAPGDRRMIISSGPFRFAPGDTQEVVIAGTAGLGSDRLSSIAAMRYNMHQVQSVYDRLFAVSGPPELSAQVSYLTGNLAEVKLTASGKAVNAIAISAILKEQSGATVTEVVLFDDGTHGDGAALDGVFANTATLNRRQAGLYADARVTDNAQITDTYERVLDSITTAGPVNLDLPEIFSDNLNNDNQANPGENVRYGLRVRNQTTFSFANVRLSPAIEFEIGKVITLPNLGASQAVSLIYNASDPNSFFSFDVPGNYDDASFHIPFVLADNQNNLWQDTLTFAIAPGPGPFTEVELQHVAGNADGNFFLRLIDRQALNDHVYNVIGVDSIDVERHRGFTLKNLTTNTILLANHPLPDSLGHNMPLIEGFKILRGTIPNENQVGMRNWSVPSGTRVWTFSNATGLPLEGFSGAIGWSSPRRLFGDGVQIVPAKAVRNTLIQFAQTDTSGNVLDSNDPNWSFAYRYGRGFLNPPARPEFAPFIVNASPGYSYQDFKKSAPFSAWDVESVPPRRLAIGFLENNAAGGSVDGKYWPPLFTRASNFASTGPREWFFIFDTAYSEAPAPSLMQEMIFNSTLPIMWMGTPARRGDGAFHAGDQFLIEAWHPVTSQDLWSFNPVVLGVAESAGPLTFALAQNYPNPFNPETQISFSLPIGGKVSLKIFNVLGQEVVTLVDTKMAPGRYAEVWRGFDRSGNLAASGVYFYRLEITDFANTSGSRFVQTHKMILLR